jgi:hypothetical protein
MKKTILYISLIMLLGFNSCKTKDYAWESWTVTAVPVVTVNTSKSALNVPVTANTSFVKIPKPDSLFDPTIANAEFEYTLNWEGFGKVQVSSIEVYLGFNRAESNPPAYPVPISQPGGLYPSAVQFPLPSRVRATDKLFATVTQFPTTYTLTVGEMAAFTGTDISTIRQNDNFLFKFIINHTDGRRTVGYQENVCDETRGEPGDCRVGVRFRHTF